MELSSLEDLLSEEGFKGTKIKTRSRFSLEPKALSMPLYFDKEKKFPVPLSSEVKIKTERIRSDMSRYKLRIQSSKDERNKSRNPRDDLVGSEKIVKEDYMRRSNKDFQIFEEMGSNEVQEFERFNVRLGEDFSGNEIDGERLRRGEIRANDRVKGKHSNGLEGVRVRGKEGNRYSNGSVERQKRNEKSNKHFVGDTYIEFEEDFLQHSRNSNRTSPNNGKFVENIRNRKFEDIELPVSRPALDEVAINAVVSILNGQITNFVKDKNFREKLHGKCLSCLNSIRLEDKYNVESKVLASLEQAMETVKRVIEVNENAKELKRAFLQFSFITSLNSENFEGPYTSGIRNSMLSACAHLYLSVIYKLQKKDKVSAKHLFQVFINSPSEARKTLLPELWDSLFLPQLLHLRVWYEKEEKSIPDTSSGYKNKNLIRKLYNEKLDLGTFQFAAYYKDWLTGGGKAPSLPSIPIPSVSFRGGSLGNSPQTGSPVGYISSQPMISKKLYDAVFGNSSVSRKMNDANEVEDGEQESFKSFTTIVSVEEDERKMRYSPPHRKFTGEQIHAQSTAAQSGTRIAEKLLSTTNGGWRSGRTRAFGEEGLKSEIKNIHMLSQIARSPHKNANELILKMLAESVFQQKQPDNSVDIVPAVSISHLEDLPVSFQNLGDSSSSLEGQYASDNFFEDGSFFSTMPKDFICPLTGELFEDPVTLESGQTFDRVAIKEWFDQGNRTCPVTGKILESLSVPITNLVLKRVIEGWQSEHCRNLLAFASQIEGNISEHAVKTKDERAILILEQLLFGFRAEERFMNAKNLISLGGLQFLVRRFELGNLDEKARIASLLCCCIEAQRGCQEYLTRNIKRTCLLELLYNNQAKSRINAVLLLVDLISLNRITEIVSFLSSLQKEGAINAMHVLLVYLQTCSLEQKPLIAVLLLYFDLLAEPQNYSIYREEAIDSIIMALDCSLTDGKVRQQCCRALLILGGQFSYSGELENWCLWQAGFYDKESSSNDLENEDSSTMNRTVPPDEEKAREDWWTKLAASLLVNGKKSFLEVLSKCLGSESLDLVKTCLITVAWMSQALTSLPDLEFQLSAVSVLVLRLKQISENGEQIEHRFLASMSLLSFSKFSGD